MTFCPILEHMNCAVLCSSKAAGVVSIGQNRTEKRPRLHKITSDTTLFFGRLFGLIGQVRYCFGTASVLSLNRFFRVSSLSCLNGAASFFRV